MTSKPRSQKVAPAWHDCDITAKRLRVFEAILPRAEPFLQEGASHAIYELLTAMHADLIQNSQSPALLKKHYGIPGQAFDEIINLLMQAAGKPEGQAPLQKAAQGLATLIHCLSHDSQIKDVFSQTIVKKREFFQNLPEIARSLSLDFAQVEKNEEMIRTLKKLTNLREPPFQRQRLRDILPDTKEVKIRDILSVYQGRAFAVKNISKGAVLGVIFNEKAPPGYDTNTPCLWLACKITPPPSRSIP